MEANVKNHSHWIIRIERCACGEDNCRHFRKSNKRIPPYETLCTWMPRTFPKRKSDLSSISETEQWHLSNIYSRKLQNLVVDNCSPLPTGHQPTENVVFLTTHGRNALKEFAFAFAKDFPHLFFAFFMTETHTCRSQKFQSCHIMTNVAWLDRQESTDWNDRNEG